MKKSLIITVLLSGFISILVFVLGTYFLRDLKNKQIATLSLGEEYTIVAGVIRNKGDGWNLIQDNDHETIGISSVEQTDEKIIVHYNEKSKVNALSVTVDETMASEGYTVGASVGKSETWILIYKNSTLVNPKDYINDKGNIWIEGIFKK